MVCALFYRNLPRIKKGRRLGNVGRCILAPRLQVGTLWKQLSLSLSNLWPVPLVATVLARRPRISVLVRRAIPSPELSAVSAVRGWRASCLAWLDLWAVREPDGCRRACQPGRFGPCRRWHIDRHCCRCAESDGEIRQAIPASPARATSSGPLFAVPLSPNRANPPHDQTGKQAEAAQGGD